MTVSPTANQTSGVDVELDVCLVPAVEEERLSTWAPLSDLVGRNKLWHWQNELIMGERTGRTFGGAVES